MMFGTFHHIVAYRQPAAMMRCVPEVIILDRNVIPCVQYDSPSWDTFSRTLVLKVYGQFFKLTLR